MRNGWETKQQVRARRACRRGAMGEAEYASRGKEGKDAIHGCLYL
jgi:hypothetical protein